MPTPSAAGGSRRAAPARCGLLRVVAVASAAALALPRAAAVRSAAPPPPVELDLLQQEAFVTRVEMALYREPLLTGEAKRGVRAVEWRDAVTVIARGVLTSTEIDMRMRGCNAVLRILLVLDPQEEGGVLSYATKIANNCFFSCGPDADLLKSAMPHLDRRAAMLIGHMEPPLLWGREGWTTVDQKIAAPPDEDLRAIHAAVDEFIRFMPHHLPNTAMVISMQKEMLWIHRALLLGQDFVKTQSISAQRALHNIICHVGFFQSIGRAAKEVAIGAEAFPAPEDIDPLVRAAPTKSSQAGCRERLEELSSFAEWGKRHRAEEVGRLLKVQEGIDTAKSGRRRTEHPLQPLTDEEIDQLGRMLLPFTPSDVMESASDILLQTACLNPYNRHMQALVASVISRYAPERPKDHFLMPFILGSHKRGDHPDAICSNALAKLWEERDALAKKIKISAVKLPVGLPA